MFGRKKRDRTSRKILKISNIFTVAHYHGRYFFTSTVTPIFYDFEINVVQMTTAVKALMYTAERSFLRCGFFVHLDNHTQTPILCFHSRLFPPILLEKRVK